jgi:hypothetical protein
LLVRELHSGGGDVRKTVPKELASKRIRAVRHDLEIAPGEVKTVQWLTPVDALAGAKDIDREEPVALRATDAQESEKRRPARGLKRIEKLNAVKARLVSASVGEDYDRILDARNGWLLRCAGSLRPNWQSEPETENKRMNACSP